MSEFVQSLRKAMEADEKDERRALGAKWRGKWAGLHVLCAENGGHRIRTWFGDGETDRCDWCGFVKERRP